MWFWWFMFFSDILVPIIMIIAGFWLYKFPPKDINTLFGYRTVRSMQSPETWLFAQKYSGKVWMISGFIVLTITALIHIPLYGVNDNVIGTLGAIIVLIQIIILLFTLYPVEIALKKKFGE